MTETPFQECQRVIRELRAENERLMAALKEIEQTEWAIGPMVYREMARRALEKK